MDFRFTEEQEMMAGVLRDLLAESNAVPKRLASTVGEALDELLAELDGEAKAA